MKRPRLRSASGPRVVACAIMKDEESEITPTVESLRACLGADLAGVVIHDTGSLDRTNEIAHDLGCHVECRLFDDFASARNAAIDTAREHFAVPWILPFSAGARFSGKFKAGAGQALAHVEVRGAARFLKVGPIRRGSGLRYAGRTHETIVGAGNVEDLNESGLIVDYSGDTKDRRPRWELDLTLLEHDYSSRGRFYYAQTLDCLGRYAEAFAAYMARADLEGYPPERRQAVANAVRTAPNMAIARFVTNLAPLCADVFLEMAIREERAKNHHMARVYARDAIHLAANGERSMFERTDLHEICERILST